MLMGHMWKNKPKTGGVFGSGRKSGWLPVKVFFGLILPSHAKVSLGKVQKPKLLLIYVGEGMCEEADVTYNIKVLWVVKRQENYDIHVSIYCILNL